MPSPDLSQLVDLTLDDRDAQDIFDTAVANIAAKFPGLVLREASIEAVTLESMATEAAENTFKINRLPGTIVEVLLRLYGIVRSPGLASVATVTFALSDSLGHQIPAGLRLRLSMGAGANPVDFTVDTAVIAAPGASSVTAAITATQLSDNANGTPAGTYLEVLDAISFVNSAQLATPVTGGADQESQEAWLSRGAQRFGRLTSTLVIAKHFVAAALEDTRVYRAYAVDNNDGTTTANGHIAIAVLGPGGVTLSSGVKASIAAALDGQTLGNLTVHVIDPTVTPVNVTVTVHALPGFNSATVQAACVAALQAYLNTDSWPWAATVRRNELISLLDQVAGVDYVDTPTTPSGDVSLSGVAPLASAGTISVTVAP